MLAELRSKSQVTIPKDIVKRLGLKEGDNIDISIENNNIVITPVMMIPKDQAWYWSKEWQEGEKEADEDLKAGRITKAMNKDEALKHLDDLKS